MTAQQNFFYFIGIFFGCFSQEVPYFDYGFYTEKLWWLSMVDLAKLSGADPGFPVGGDADVRRRCFEGKMCAKTKELSPV